MFSSREENVGLRKKDEDVGLRSSHSRNKTFQKDPRVMGRLERTCSRKLV